MSSGRGIRQSMSDLHTWAGLLLGWVLYAMFLTGTVSYFKDELSQWMRPELPRLSRALDPAVVAQRVADEITKTLAICMQCGNPAKHTQRLVASEDLIVVGAAGMYEARCRRCLSSLSVWRCRSLRSGSTSVTGARLRTGTTLTCWASCSGRSVR